MEQLEEKEAADVRPVAAAESSEPDTLTLAAESLERGDRAGAAGHLETYVVRHPEQVMFRMQLAEMLFQLDRVFPAKAHYERFIADAARLTGPARNHLITAHTRLLELAQRAGDEFGEQFHRGAGLLLLAQEQEKQEDADPAFCEEMLCKSLKALGEARDLKPTDRGTRLALAAAYERLGNPRAAEAERIAARGALMPTDAAGTSRRNCPLLSVDTR